MNQGGRPTHRLWLSASRSGHASNHLKPRAGPTGGTTSTPLNRIEGARGRAHETPTWWRSGDGVSTPMRGSMQRARSVQTSFSRQGTASLLRVPFEWVPIRMTGPIEAFRVTQKCAVFDHRSLDDAIFDFGFTSSGVGFRCSESCHSRRRRKSQGCSNRRRMGERCVEKH